ncbi:MAG: right-handed parallel beta-helix repeat-containing protein [Pseudobutyrivibrio ruminis]|uniref:Right-handed parallel beta-helix repeat-containing protein n=1 Tax=Pseudobutyrivibrio ruminis TaxID=46206 RepID=A0A927UBE3_9FIRM|nr:right-handed parallel beta-helix repeat-containing protein [Pseudobutyrivibrio ruminis]
MRKKIIFIPFIIVILVISSFTYDKFLNHNNSIYGKELTTESLISYSQLDNQSISHINKYLDKGNKTTEYNNKIKEIANSVLPEKTIYFSTSGKDSNNGLSANSPKKNPVPFIESGNYTVLLKAGDTFYMDKSIQVGSNIRISTYGDKQKAHISFLQQSSNSFQIFDSSKNIYCLKLNGNTKDTGWIAIDGTQYWKKMLTNSLNNDGEYWVDSASGILYLKSSSDIIGKKFKYSQTSNGFFLNNGSKCSIENLEIYGCGYHGISIVSYSNLLVNNCFVHDIGGAIHTSTGVKYGNGIQVWATDSHDIIIANNTVSNCFDAGLTVQIDDSQKKDAYQIYFINNYVDRCNYGFECFQSGLNCSIHDIVVSNNIFFDIKDITDGYRLTKYSNDCTSYLCLWYCDNNQDNILIKNNIGYKTERYAINYAYDSAAHPYVFNNNLLQATDTKAAIKNPQNHTGDSSQIDYSLINMDEYRIINDYFTTNYTSDTVLK